MEKALAYVCCPADAGKAKVQKYCRKIYELGYVPICPQFGFSPFLDEGEAEDMQAFQRMSLQLMKDVIQICEPGGRILDPFAGSGTTILAAVEEGYEAVGIEVTDVYYGLGTERIRSALKKESQSGGENHEP